MVPWTIVRESVMKNKNSNKKKESKLKDNKGIKLERFSEKTQSRRKHNNAQ